MLLLEAKNIKMSYGDDLLFSFDEFSVNENDRIGLVGENGCGKTTLLKILTSQISDYKGQIKKHGSITYFQQFGIFENTANNQSLKELGVKHKAEARFASGGERTRLRLAETFSNTNHLLIMDEPTTNLDIEGIQLLEKKISSYKSFIIVSHDIDLLNKYCTTIVEICDKTLHMYPGNYNSYQQQKKLKYDTELKEYEQYVDEKKRLTEVYKKKIEQAGKLRNKPKNVSNSEFKMRNFVAVSKSNSGRQKNMQRAAKAVQSRINQMEVKEKPSELPQIRMDYALTDPPGSKYIVRAENFDFAYGCNKIFSKQSFYIKNGSKTALIGKNGCGKTTLLNLIRNGFNDFMIAPNAKFGSLYQEFSNIKEDMTVLDNVLIDNIQQIDVVRNVMARLLFDENDIRKKAYYLSGGEKVKLSLAKLLVSKVNVLLLDEPTNYLDLNSIQALTELLKRYEGTILFASHDRNFVNEIATDLLRIVDHNISCFEGNLLKFEEESKEKEKNKDMSTNITLLELKLLELGQQLDSNCKNKEELEKQYFEVSKKIRLLKEQAT